MTDGYTVELKSAAYSGFPANVNPTGIDSATADSTRDTRSISYALTNSYKPQTTTVAVQKTWVGPAADSVSVKLQSSNNDGATWSDVNGATATLTAEGGWTASFADLPVYELGMQGVKRTYRVVEEAVDIYETVYKVGSVLSDGVVEPVAGETESVEIVNTNIEKTDIVGVKVWNDHGNKDGTRPKSIAVRLFADGEEIATKTVSAADAKQGVANTWAFSFTDLAKYDATDGHEIAYTLKEDAVEGYTSTLEGNAADGFTVTNTADEKPSKPEEPAKPEQPKKTDKKGKLPGTGDTGYMAAAAVGMGSFLLLAAGVALRRRTDC